MGSPLASCQAAWMPGKTNHSLKKRRFQALPWANSSAWRSSVTRLRTSSFDTPSRASGPTWSRSSRTKAISRSR